MITKIKTITSLLTLQLVALILVSNTVLAADDCQGGNATACLSNGSPGQVMKLLELGINILAAFVGVAAIIMFIVGGIQYITSNGNPQAVSAAKKRITDVLIGLLAFVFLYAFLQWLIPGGQSIF